MGATLIKPEEEKEWESYINICKKYGFEKILFGCYNMGIFYEWHNPNPDPKTIIELKVHPEDIILELEQVAVQCKCFGDQNYAAELFFDKDSKEPNIHICRMNQGRWNLIEQPENSTPSE